MQGVPPLVLGRSQGATVFRDPNLSMSFPPLLHLSPGHTSPTAFKGPLAESRRMTQDKLNINKLYNKISMENTD